MILKNCKVLTGNLGEVIENGSVYIKNEKIIDVGETEKILEKYPDEQTKDLDGKIILPGLSNPYTSFYINELSMLYMLINSKLSPYEKFSKIVGYSEKLVDEEKLFEYIIKLGGYKSMINGITSTIVSIPYSKNISKIKELCDSIGIKIKPSPVFLTETGIPRAYRDDLINNTEISSITLLGVWGLEKEDYEFLKKFINSGKRVRIVIIDFKQEERYCKLKYGKNLLSVFKENNILSKNIDIIFAGNVNSEIIDFFSSKSVRLIKSLRAELSELEKTPDLLDMLGRGMKVSIGTGTTDYSIFDEAKTLLVTEKSHNKSKASIIYNEVERTIFMNNYLFTSEEFGVQLGKIAPGTEADITILNSRTGVFKFTSNTPFTEISFKIGSELEVFGTIVGGKIAMWDRKPKIANVKEIKKIQKKLNKFVDEINL